MSPPSSPDRTVSPLEPPPIRAAIVAEARLPTQHGDFQVVVFRNDRDTHEHVALVRNDVSGCEDVPTRLHSACLTGDVLTSLRCDCREQLSLALEALGHLPRGILLYMHQEGRGIGLANKIRAYALQDRGLDTIDANRALGFRDDEREYGVAAAMLRTLGVRSVQLMTNNPDKLEKLSALGITVTRRLPLVVVPNDHNREYLRTKAERSGHWLEPDEGAGRSERGARVR